MENRAIIETIRGQYQNGQITLDQAKSLIQPILDEANKKGAVVAKRFGRRFYKLTFNYVFR